MDSLKRTQPFNGLAQVTSDAQRGLDDSIYQQWVSLLEKRTGVLVTAPRRPFLESRIRQRMREIGLTDPIEYLESLQRGPLAALEWAVLVDRLTVHETHFYRHVPSYELVRDRVVPEYLHGLKHGRHEHAFHAWSVGCSTGEEAYSLAMMLSQISQSQLQPFHFGVTGTDVSQPSLKTARAGVYGQERILEVPELYRSRYCIERDDGQFEISARITGRTGFAAVNLMDIRSFPIQQVELIFCHNVLIYFSMLKRQEILHHMVRFLRPGGYLVLAPGEIPHWTHPLMTLVKHHRTLAFQRLAGETDA